MLWLCDHRGRAGLRWLSAVRELSRGVGGGGGGSHAWDVLLEIRCADSKPHGPWEWGAPSYLYTITFGRHCPYGPLMWRGGRCVVPHDRPGCVWRRHAGQLPERQHEQALARTVPARAVDTEWRALCVEPHGPGAQTGGWRSARRVYHTRLFWALQGDPRGGRTRVFTTTMVDTMFFLGRRRRKAGAFGTTGRLMVRLSPLKTAAGPEPRQGRATTAAIRAGAPAAAAWAGVGRAAGRGARPVRQGAWRRQHRRVRCRSRSEPHEQPGLHHCWRHRCQAAERQRGVATRDDASLHCYVDHSLVSCIGNNRTGVARFTRPMENASAAVVLHAP